MTKQKIKNKQRKDAARNGNKTTRSKKCRIHKDRA